MKTAPPTSEKLIERLSDGLLRLRDEKDNIVDVGVLGYEDDAGFLGYEDAEGVLQVRHARTLFVTRSLKDHDVYQNDGERVGGKELVALHDAVLGAAESTAPWQGHITDFVLSDKGCIKFALVLRVARNLYVRQMVYAYRVPCERRRVSAAHHRVGGLELA